MNNLEKAIVMTMATGVISLAGVIQADAHGLGDTDFKVKASVLNVRTEPSTTTGVVKRKLKQGAVVRPVELTQDRNWARIGENEWVSFGYLEMIDNSTIPENGTEYPSIKPTKYIITASSLNLRKEPSTNSSIVGKFNKNQVVHATKTHGKWLYVEDGHINGWIHGNYAKEYSTQNNKPADKPVNKPSASIKEETISMRELEVKVSSLNIRKGPSTDSAIVGNLKKGQTRMCNVKSGNWYKIEDGWIHKDYVDVTIWSLNSNSNWEGGIDAPPGEFSMERTVSVGKGTNLLVRYTRALGGSVKDKLPNGSKVTIINDYNGVAYIKYINAKGRLEFGYVASQYLKQA